jgi:hypothetical protein
MRSCRRSRLAFMSVAAGIAGLAFATPGWAATTTPPEQSNVPVRAPGGDPKGANGTVKIDGPEFDNGIDNEPHPLPCVFRVTFFNFDAQERGNIVFTLQQQPGPGIQLLRRDNVLISADRAGGRKDADETYTFAVSEFGLDAYEPQNQQGFHIKLTVERIGAPGAGKHKVFWVKPCKEKAPSSPPSSPPPSKPSNGAGGESLPITGTAIGGFVILGLGLVAGGVILLVLWRRQDVIKFEP